MKRLSLVLLLITISAYANATTNVRGRVLAADGKPYASVAVTLGHNPTVYTDRQGMFRVNHVTPGRYTLVIATSRRKSTFNVTAQPREFTDLSPVSVP
jgi:hypothetical protein